MNLKGLDQLVMSGMVSPSQCDLENKEQALGETGSLFLAYGNKTEDTTLSSRIRGNVRRLFQRSMTEKSSSEIEIDFKSSREALVLVLITGE